MNTGNFNYSVILMLTLSSSDRVAFSAPSGRPNGKQYLEKPHHVNNRAGACKQAFPAL